MEMSIKLAVAQTTGAKKKRTCSGFKWKSASFSEKVLTDGALSRGNERLTLAPGVGYLEQLLKDCWHPLLGYRAIAEYLFVLPGVLTFCWSTCRQLRIVLGAKWKL